MNASPDLQVLVTTVRITIPAPGRTSQAAGTQDPPWHDLVATPGRAITYELSTRVQDKWDAIAESAAVASSRGIASEQALSLRTIGRRRTVSIREAARAAGLSGRSLQRREIQISSFGKIFLEGQSIYDTAPTPDELVLVGTATSVDRVILVGPQPPGAGVSQARRASTRRSPRPAGLARRQRPRAAGPVLAPPLDDDLRSRCRPCSSGQRCELWP